MKAALGFSRAVRPLALPTGHRKRCARRSGHGGAAECMKKFQPLVAKSAAAKEPALAERGGAPTAPSAQKAVEEWDVVYVRKGPKKHVKWHDGVVRRETPANGNADRLVLLDVNGASIGRATIKSSSLGPLVEDAENDKIFTGYKLNVLARRGVAPAQKRPLGPANAVVDAPAKKLAVFCAPASRVPIVARKQERCFAAPARVAVKSAAKIASFIIVESPRVELQGSVAAKLRPHQLDAVKFLYTCVSGRNAGNCNGGCGAILADDMGLGKTLTTLVLLRVVCKATVCVNEDVKCRKVRKAAIICPATMVSQWRQENIKWFGRLSSNLNFIAALETAGGSFDGRAETPREAIDRWISANARAGSSVLIVSYETCMRNANDILKENQLDMLILDEGHRLKNRSSKASMAIRNCAARKRLLITGTPVMNNLDEFWALADIVNPGTLGSLEDFRRSTARRIEAGARRGATSDQTEAAEYARDDVRELAKTWFLRRRAGDVERKWLPNKTEHVVCCRMKPAQIRAYRAVCDRAMAGSACHLGAVAELRNLSTRGPEVEADVPIAEISSGKIDLLVALVLAARAKRDRLVLVSTSTQTLDVIERICIAHGWRFSRLDGATSAEKRASAVQNFNSPSSLDDVFLLSSRAGGCGINLVGANRLVLLDADWNPATDEQAMARVWREGQTKPVHVYRLLSTGSIDEKMIQRQLAKHHIADGVVDGAQARGALDDAELKVLFTYEATVASTTYLAMNEHEETASDWPPFGGASSIIADDILREVAENTQLVTYVRSALYRANGKPPEVIGKLCKPIEEDQHDATMWSRMLQGNIPTSTEGNVVTHTDEVQLVEEHNDTAVNAHVPPRRRVIRDDDEADE